MKELALLQQVEVNKSQAEQLKHFTQENGHKEHSMLSSIKHNTTEILMSDKREKNSQENQYIEFVRQLSKINKEDPEQISLELKFLKNKTNQFYNELQEVRFPNVQSKKQVKREEQINNVMKQTWDQYEQLDEIITRVNNDDNSNFGLERRINHNKDNLSDMSLFLKAKQAMSKKEPNKKLAIKFINSMDDINVFDKSDGRTLLTYALEQDLVEVVKCICTKVPDVNIEDANDNIALNYGAKFFSLTNKEKAEYLEYIIKDTNDVNHVSIEFGHRTALHSIIEAPHGHKTIKQSIITKLIQEYGASLFIENEEMHKENTNVSELAKERGYIIEDKNDIQTEINLRGEDSLEDDF